MNRQAICVQKQKQQNCNDIVLDVMPFIAIIKTWFRAFSRAGLVRSTLTDTDPCKTPL